MGTPVNTQVDRRADTLDRLHELINALTMHGLNRAMEEGIPFSLKSEDMFRIVQDHVNQNKRYLTPGTIRHYERLLFGAVVYCNRMMACGTVSDILDALEVMNAERESQGVKLR